jgi:hypothetical protein
MKKLILTLATSGVVLASISTIAFGMDSARTSDYGSMPVLSCMPEHSSAKATTFTYSEMNAEKVGLKLVDIGNQAGNMFAVGFASPASMVVPNQKISLRIDKWCEAEEYNANRENGKALDETPGYPWLLTLSLVLDNGEWVGINSGWPILVDKGQNVNIKRTGHKSATIEVEK